MKTRECTVAVSFFEDDESVGVDGLEIPVGVETRAHIPCVVEDIYAISSDFVVQIVRRFMREHGSETYGNASFGSGDRHHRRFREAPDPSKVLFVTRDDCCVGVPEEDAA